MYSDATLTNYLQTSSAVATKSKVLAEWNLNTTENIRSIGNYKNRPIASNTANTLPDTWVYEDDNTPEASRTWYGFTNYDTVIDSGYVNESDIPVTFRNANLRQQSLLSLEDCFSRFRPRSGINKLRLLQGKKILPVLGDSSKIFSRPRYYAADASDNFKYWSSYREDTAMLGISKTGDPYLIQDAAPFVVYKDKVPTNRIVMKIQTNVGAVDSGKYINPTSPANKDPFFIGSTPNYKSTPLHWKIEKYNGTNWVPIYSTENLEVPDVFTNPDGYFELSYGITNIPEDYTNNFSYVGTFASTSALPLIQDPKQIGQAYLVKSSDTAKGKFYIYNGLITDVALTNYDELDPTYGWYKSEESITNAQMFVTELDKTAAPKYGNAPTEIYREFEYIQGLRVVVNRMVNQSVAFDLIELSPRLVADITDIVTSFSIKKYASDLGVSNLPVGQLLAGTGSISLIDYEEVFNLNSQTSLLNVYDGDVLKTTFVNKNLQLKFYEAISQILQGSSDYKDFYIPIKTMYADGFPQYDDSNRNLEMNLRDLTFYLESRIAPEMLLIESSLSYIISSLLDSIGFSNYNFLRKDGVPDEVIPYFMVAPNKTVMQILQELAIATQTTMFFDEANNFVVMSKEYLVPDSSRPTDITLYGSDNDGKKANIINISSESNDIYNDGKIVHYNRYIKRAPNNLTSLSYLDRYQTQAYQRVILWTVDGTRSRMQSKNEEPQGETGYSLSATILEKTLTDQLPEVKNGVVINNTMDLGDSSYWLSNYNGYVYANGEIIKYDAVQYTVTSTTEVNLVNPQTPVRVTGKPIGTTVTLSTSVPHGFSVGDLAVISGASGYNGTYPIVEVPSPTSFTFVSGQVGTINTAGKVSSISTVWISSDSEYRKYFSLLSFGAKMYKTGVVRISAEPFYSTDNTALIEGKVSKHGRGQFGTKPTTHYSAADGDKDWSKVATPLVCNYQHIFNRKEDDDDGDRQYEINSGVTATITNNRVSISKKTMRQPSTTIANFLSLPKTDLKTGAPTFSSQVQSSALIFDGPSFAKKAGTNEDAVPQSAPSCINYVKKDLSSRATKFDTFGTRMRILGSPPKRLDKDGGYIDDVYSQNPIGSYSIFNIKTSQDVSINSEINASSGGIAIKTNANGEGYYLEIAAINYSNIENLVTSNGATAEDVFFYKMKLVNNILQPTVLFSTYKNIFADAGIFTGKVKNIIDREDSVYDLSVRMSNRKVGNKTVNDFEIYLNNDNIGSVSDTSPITNLQENVSLFIRGSSRVMFENVFALDTTGYDSANKTSEEKSMFNIFDNKAVSNLTYNKHYLNNLLVSGFLSNINASKANTNTVYYEEFGTVMREVAYFNAKFDKAYPALRSTVSPNPASLGGWFVAGYNATPYRAEFLVFNTTDFTLNLGDNKEGSTQLNISGISFTQEVANELTVDSYYNNRIQSSREANSADAGLYRTRLTDIRNNRKVYGSKAFTIDSPYIQSQEMAENLMSWVVEKVSKPRKAVGVEIFGMPIIQLGDIIEFYYDESKTKPNAVTGSRFVVYGIEHDTEEAGPSTKLYLSEVV
jgi:hypothetical protein